MVVLVVVFVVFLVVVVVVGLGVVIGILTGVVDVNSLVTKIGRLCMSVKSCEAEILKMLEAASFPAAAFFSVSEDEVDRIEEDPDEAEASEVNVVVEVGFNFGLLHKLSAPPCKNQGGNGLFVVVTKTRGAHAK